MDDSKPLESIEGVLEQILFVSDSSGYTVARLDLVDDQEIHRPVSIVGDLAGVEVGAGLKLSGHFEVHPKYGNQFKVAYFEIARPAGIHAIERYLASGQIRGVGPKLARRIADHFGDRLNEILEKEPQRLREVSGLSKIVIARLTAAWQDASGLRELSVFLRGHGISAGHAMRIHKVFGRESLQIIRKDPYLLARTITGIGFRTADAVAEQVGVARNSIERARAALLYLLELMADDGHVYAPFAYLENRFRSALDMDPDLAEPAIAELKSTSEVTVEPTDDGLAVYLNRLHKAELNVAQRIRLLTRGRPMAKSALERALAKAERLTDIKLSFEQRAALRCALESKFAVITGGPGTGKTTLLRSLLAALDDAGTRATLTAPTGRAARRLAEATGRDAKTIHRLLEYSPDRGEFLRDESFPLRTNFLVVDEASMMDLELASSLLSALLPTCSVVLVGDRDQLPSVGPGSVLKDVIASELVPVIQLKEVYRQARQSLIVANAHKINRGWMPETSASAEGDFFFIERNAPEDVLATIKQVVIERLPGKFGIRDPRDVQVITPMNRGPIGVHSLNQELQRLLNPSGCELRLGDRRLREGDRVIQLRNDYDKQIFNGDIGRVTSIDSARGRLEASFDEKLASYDWGELDELALAYAISVHKSQGSQYPAVVMPLHQTHYLMLRRNLLYTAITRAERVCVLVGTRRALQQAVRNEEERRRFSRLSERLRLD